MGTNLRTAHRVGAAARHREADRSQCGRQRRIDGDGVAAERHHQADGCLSAQHRVGEHVVYDRKAESGIGIQAGGQVPGEVRGDLAARHLTGEGHVGPGSYRRVVSDVHQRPARHLGGGGETSIEAGTHMLTPPSSAGAACGDSASIAANRPTAPFRAARSTRDARCSASCPALHDAPRQPLGRIRDGHHPRKRMLQPPGAF